jgi:DNA-binding transcriptional ArsR family regulator
MIKFLLDVESSVSEDEESLIRRLKPEFNRICYNSVRASIIHLLMKSKNLNYSLSVERIANRLGKRHSVILYHLEKLEKWNLVVVVKHDNYGSKKRRSIWGLNPKHPKLIREIYLHLLRTFYTIEELERLCNINRNVRVV